MQKAANLLLAGLDAKTIRQELHAAQLWGELTAFRAGHITLAQVDCAQGFYPLCSYCEHNGDCPKFPQGLQMPQWEPTLEKLAALKEQRMNPAISGTLILAC